MFVGGGGGVGVGVGFVVWLLMCVGGGVGVGVGGGGGGGGGAQLRPPSVHMPVSRARAASGRASYSQASCHHYLYTSSRRTTAQSH